MSIDPINPGYLDHIFDGALREPRRIERIDGQNERQRSEEESARRRTQGRGESYGDDELGAQTGGDEDGREPDDLDEAAPETDEFDQATTNDLETRFEDELIEAEMVEDSAVTVSSSADEGPDLELDPDSEQDEDAVVVEFDGDEPSPLIERRRNPPRDGHIDFEA